MPELPEVETVVQGLRPHLVERRITDVSLSGKQLRLPWPAHFAQRLAGRTILDVQRRAKFILMPLTGGETLISHLGMSGRYTVFPPDMPSAEALGAFYFQPAAAREPGPHDHLILRLHDGTRVVYTDPRRFGLFDLVASETIHAHPMLAGLGPEPLDENTFTPAYLASVLARRQAPVKTVLLDQSVVAGLGNIYACEALFLAGISPRRTARSLAPSGRPGKPVNRLVDAIRKVLCAAIAAGGSTLRDHAQVNGEHGMYQQQFFVYGRAGAPCRQCGAPIRQIVQSGRSTFFCSRCQR